MRTPDSYENKRNINEDFAEQILKELYLWPLEMGRGEVREELVREKPVSEEAVKIHIKTILKEQGIRRFKASSLLLIF